MLSGNVVVTEFQGLAECLFEDFLAPAMTADDRPRYSPRQARPSGSPPGAVSTMWNEGENAWFSGITVTEAAPTTLCGGRHEARRAEAMSVA